MEIQQMAGDWLEIGLTLALIAIFATGVAFWTRWTAEAKIQGQTIWHVVVGVAGVVVISSLRVGLVNASFLIICFTVAGFPMAIEYFGRLKREEAAAQKALEESVDVNTSANREA